MKIDFRKIQTKGIDNKIIPRDLSQELGNAIFQRTTDIGELDLARDIYHKGEIEVGKKEAAMLKKYVEQYFLAFVKEVLLPVLNKILSDELGKLEDMDKK